MDRFLATLAALVMLTQPGPACAAERSAQSQEIDRLIQARLDQAKIPASPEADDAEFLRRAYLDITGRIPTYEQTTAFLASKEPDKRARLIDELLAQPEYGLHFATIWRDLIVDRSSESAQVRQNYSWELITWMAEGFNKDRPWSETVTALLTAEGEAKKAPAATFILANRMNDFPRPADIVGMSSKLFLGLQLRCAQCHDHPYVEEWKQDDFWALAAFFSQLRDHGMEPNGNSRNPVFYERPNPDAKKEDSYMKRLVRAGLLPPQTGARIAIPHIADPAQTLRTVNAKYFLGKKPSLPEKGPYRADFAAWMTSTENPFFARAAANRLWSHFFARGLVNPIDDMRPTEPPSHPELLALLEKELKTSGFSQKHLIRCICNSKAYQRTSRPLPRNTEDKTLYSHMAIKVLNADQTIDSLSIAVGRVPPTGKNRDKQTTPFATREADDDATELTHGIPQFLQQMNAGPASSPPPLLNKLTVKKSAEEAITALYLAVLSRSPRSSELERMAAYVSEASNPSKAYHDIYWVLLNSAEFILNH